MSVDLNAGMNAGMNAETNTDTKIDSALFLLVPAALIAFFDTEGARIVMTRKESYIATEDQPFAQPSSDVDTRLGRPSDDAKGLYLWSGQVAVPRTTSCVERYASTNFDGSWRRLTPQDVQKFALGEFPEPSPYKDTHFCEQRVSDGYETDACGKPAHRGSFCRAHYEEQVVRWRDLLRKAKSDVEHAMRVIRELSNAPAHRFDLHGVLRGTMVQNHPSCPDPSCCLCECKGCKQAWFAANRPSPKDCRTHGASLGALVKKAMAEAGLVVVSGEETDHD